jgi:hypothetical protein
MREEQKDGQAGTQNLKTRPAAIDDLQNRRLVR